LSVSLRNTDYAELASPLFRVDARGVIFPLASVVVFGNHASPKSRESLEAYNVLTDPLANSSLSIDGVGAQACLSNSLQLDSPRKMAPYPSADGEHTSSIRDCRLPWNRVCVEVYMQPILERTMTHPSPELIAYYSSGKPLACEIDDSPYICEFWPQGELLRWNQGYEVPIYAPGYFGFATNGGGEMYAISPQGEVVCLPFIGMEPAAALLIAPSWQVFEGKLRDAL